MVASHFLCYCEYSWQIIDSMVIVSRNALGDVLIGIFLVFLKRSYPLWIPICWSGFWYHGVSFALEKCSLLRARMAIFSSSLMFIVVQFCLLEMFLVVLSLNIVLPVDGSRWAVLLVTVTLVRIKVVWDLVAFLMFSKCWLLWICFCSARMACAVSLQFVLRRVAILVWSTWRNSFLCSTASNLISFRFWRALVYSCLESIVDGRLKGRLDIVVLICSSAISDFLLWMIFW